jgi:hypothetical protein
MRRLPAWPYMLLANGINLKKLHRDFDRTIQEDILGALNGAPSIQYGVLLAMDGRFAKPGDTPDPSSDFVVTNRFVQRLAREHRKVLFGASINPNRGEASGRKELERCLEDTPPPVLVKWVPNSQDIDASAKKHEWFYRALAEANLPLLSHAGPEHAIPVRKGHQRLGDPQLLARALDCGVTVIVAHAATAFLPREEGDCVKELAAMMKDHPRLYTDVSAMCVVCRAIETVDRVLDTIPPDRMVLGSDYPVPVNNMPWPFIKQLTFEKFLELHAIRNPIEKNYRQLLAMGFPKSIGAKAAEILPL